jgi:hypothetical protein
MWDKRVWEVHHKVGAVKRFCTRYRKDPLDSLRDFLIRRWRRNVLKSLIEYLNDEHGYLWREGIHPDIEADLVAGRDCMWRAAYATGWEWSVGSRLFFWRWPHVHRRAARDGYPPYIQSDLPAYKKTQPAERDAKVRAKVKEKLATVRHKKYIDKGEVKNLTSYFGVPKGETDIKMVYDIQVSAEPLLMGTQFRSSNSRHLGPQYQRTFVAR